MSSVIGASSLGVFNSSLAVLGDQGAAGAARAGQGGERVYVNGVNGNLIIQHQDEILIGLGLDIGVLRTYNSQGQLDGDNNDGWRIGVYKKLVLSGAVNTVGSSVVRTDGDGSDTLYSYDPASGKYLNRDGAGAYDTLSYNAGSNDWSWTDGDSRTTETYNSLGQLTQTRDSDGNTISYTYTGSLITQIYDSASNQTTHLDYSGNQLSQIRTESNSVIQTRTRYNYDGQNRLSSVTTDLSPEDNSIADGKVFTTTYSYDATSTRITGIAENAQSVASFTYIQVGSDWKVASFADGEGRVTTLSYAALAQGSSVTLTDPLGNPTQLSFDASQQLTRLQDALGNSLQYSYNGNGDIVTVTDARSGSAANVTGYEYDANGNRTLSRDALGNTVTRTYGAKNELLTETVYLVPDPDGAGAAQAGSPLTSRYSYDAENHLRFTVSSEGRVSEYQYNSAGQRIAAIQYTGSQYDLTGFSATQTLSEAQLTTWVAGINPTQSLRTDFAYDFRGNVASSTVWAAVDASGNGVADGNQSVTQYVYDQAGRLLKSIAPNTTADANDYVTQYSYDGLGRLLSTSQWVSSSETRVSLTQYDDLNRKVIFTAASGLVTTRSFDRGGLLLSVAQAFDVSQFGTSQYFYDAAGWLRMLQDPSGVRSHVLYDDAYRKVADIDGDGSLTEYVYNPNGQLTRSIRYATAVNLALLTDAQGQPTNATLAAIRPLANAADQTTRQVYDRAGRLTQVIDGLGYVTQSYYDGAGRITDVIRYANTLSAGNLASLSADPIPDDVSLLITSSTNDRHTRSFYSTDGQLLGSLDAEGYLTEYRYDAGGRLLETIGYHTSTNQALRSSGTLSQLRPPTAPQDLHSYTLYNGKGQVNGQVDGEGYLTEIVYDLIGNISTTIRYATQVTYTSGATVATLRPLANAEDQVASNVYNGANQLTQQTSSDGTITQYAYDNLGQLVSLTRAVGTGDSRTLTTRYDSQGRVIGELNGEGSAQLTGNQTQAEIDAIWAQWSIQHSYDVAGRRVSSTDQYGNVSYFYYDSDSRLTYSVSARGEVTQDLYNALNQRTETITYGTRISTTGLTGGLVSTAFSGQIDAVANAGLDSHTRYAYDQRGQLVLTTDALGYTVSHGYDGFGQETSRISQISASANLTENLAYDKRGQLTQTTMDASGINHISSSQYDAFGRVIQTTDGNGNLSSASYDKLGRQVTSTDVTGTRSSSYDALGRTLTQTDALGNVTTYSYSTQTRSTTVTTQEGVSLTTVRNRQGETASVTDGGNNTTSYSYDKNGNLKSVTNAQGVVSSTNTYDRAERLTRTVDANGNEVITTYNSVHRVLTRTVDPGGLNLTTSYTYDAQSRVATVTDANGVVTQTSYDLKGQVTSIVQDPAGLNLQTSYSYDRLGRSLSVTEGVGSSQPRTTQYTYDTLGRRTREQVDPAGLNLTTTYSFDQNGNVITQTDANGNTTRYFYDGADRLTYTLDALNGLTQRSYDAEGRITQSTRYANALTGLPTNPTQSDIQSQLLADPVRDQVARSAYDKDGRIVFTVDGSGSVTQRVYDNRNNVVQFIAYANTIATNTVNTQAAIQAAIVASNSTDQVARAVYNNLNQAVYAIDGLGFVTSNQYDPAGNVIAQTQYANSVNLAGNPTEAQVASALTTSSQDRSTRTVYDRANRVVYTLDALNFVKATQYDAVSRITQAKRYATAVNLGGNPTQAQVQAALVITVQDQTDSFVYDNAGRLTQSTDAEGYTERYQYDALGNKTVFTNKKGDTWTYGYDAASRLIAEYTPVIEVTSVTEVNGQFQTTTSQVSIETRMQYDALGNLIARTEAYGRPEARTTSYQYDALNRQVKTIFPQVSIYDAASDSLANGVAGGQSANVSNTAWVRSGTTLVPVAGTSIQVDPSFYGDKTPTSVKATVYRSDGSLVGVTTTDMGSSTQSGYGQLWTNVSNWNGQVNLSTGALSPDTYRVDIEIKDTASSSFSFANGFGSLYDNTDDTWTKTGSINITIGTTYGTVTRVEKLQTLDSQVTYDTVGNAVVNRDTAGNYSYKAYDQLGRVQYEIDAEQYVTEYRYDNFGNKTTLVRYANRISLSGHPNPAQAFSTQEVANLLLAQADHSQDRVLTNSYDKLNRITQVVEPEAYTFDPDAPAGSQYFTAGKTTKTSYDAFGDAIQQSVLKNPLTNSWIDTTFYFDNKGQKTAQVDALGYLTSFQYDAEGNLTQTTEYAKALTSWNSTSYSSPVVTTPQNTPAGAIGYDREVRFAYDRKNQKISEIRVNVEHTQVTGALGLSSVISDLTSSYGYDGVGNLTRSTDAAGATTYTYYDALGRTRAVAEPTRTSDIGTGIVAIPPLYAGSHQATVASFSSAQGLDGGEGGYYWSGNNSVSLTWDSLRIYGDGGVTVALDYTRNDASGWPIGGTANYTQQFTSKNALTGATLTWDPNANGGIASVSRVQVWKTIKNQSVLVYDSASSAGVKRLWFTNPNLTNAAPALRYRAVGASTWISASLQIEGNLLWADLAALPTDQYQYELSYIKNGETVAYATGAGSFNFAGNSSTGSTNAIATVDLSGASPRLLLQGNISGITSVDITGVGVRTASNPGNGTLAVDLSGVTRGSYNYTVVGNSSAGGSFELKAGVAPSVPVIQEVAVGGVQYLGVYGIPADAVSVTFSYRRVGDTGPYLGKTIANGSNGWLVEYDDIGDSRYDYVVDIVRAGNVAAQHTGSVDIKRGGNLASVTQTGASGVSLTPLAVLKLDIFGNTVTKTVYAKGAASANEQTYTFVGIDAAKDRTEYHFFNALGSETRSVDAAGAQRFTSYDASGRAAKNWQPFTTVDGKLNNKISFYEYDKLGQQSATREVTDVSGKYLQVDFTSVSAAQAYINSSIAASAHYDSVPTGYDESGNPIGWTSVWSGSNSVNLSWNALADLGGGDVMVTLNYNRTVGASSQITQTFSSSAANSGVAINWSDPEGSNYGVSAITRMQVWKKDAGGQWILMHDRPGSGAYGNWLTWQSAPAGTQQAFNYRDVAGGNWQVASTVNLGSKTLVNISGAASTTYQYELFDTYTGQTSPYAHAVGNYTVSGISVAVSGGSAVSSVQLAIATESISSSITASAHYYSYPTGYDEGGNVTGWATAWEPASSITLNWAPLSALGDGDVMVTVDYNRAVGAATSRTATFSSAAAANGATLSWSDTDPNNSGVSAVTRMQVWKKDASGQWALMMDRNTNGAYANRLAWAVPSVPGTTAVFNYRATGSTVWLSLPIANLGLQMTVDLLGLANGNYEYQLLYTNPNDGSTATAGSGAFVVNGSTGSIAASANTAVYSPATDLASTVTDTAQYNAFGEITAKGDATGLKSFNRYDNAGRLWYGDDKTGTHMAYLYDLQGQTTAQLSSQSVDLSAPGYQKIQDIAGLSSLLRTTSQYDALGRVVTQAAPTFNVNAGLEAISSPLSLAQRSLSFAVQQSSYYSCDESGCNIVSSNIVNLGWNSMANWGSGDVVVTVDYIRATGQAASVTNTYSAGSATSGVSFSWSDANNSSAYGLSSVSRVRVSKKDNNGQLVLVHDRSSNGAYGTQITLTAPAEVGAGVNFNYRLSGASSWNALSASNFGGNAWVSLLGIANGTYDYELLYTHAGETAPYSHATGAFTVSGTTGSLTQNAAAPASVLVTPTTYQSYDRWGNTLSTSDARNSAWITNYRYDQSSQLVEMKSPTVSQLSEAGVSSNITPTLRNYYDLLGRVVGVVDANGNVNTARYDEVGQLIREYHADSGVVYSAYDIFGNLVQVIDANNKVTTSSYDKADRVTTVQHPIGVDSYVYDQLGNRIKATNGDGEATQYWYDPQGHVLRTRLPMGQETTEYYDNRGRKNYEANGNGDFATWSYDYFGKLTAHTDLGGATHSYTYNYLNGILTQSNSHGQNFAFTYREDGRLKQHRDITNNSQSDYQYDAVGNRTRETYTQTGVIYQDARTSFDALNRITQVSDNRYTLQYSYDANGNRRRSLSNYYDSTNTLKTIDNWYKYDSMNRIVLSQGALVNGSIQIGSSVANIVPVTRTDVTVTGSDVSYSGPTGWGIADAYSSESYTGSAYVSAVAGQADMHGMFGLNSDPLADKNYTSLDYAWYTHAGGVLGIYESGVSLGNFGAYSTGDVLSVEYDGSNIVYKQNGVVKRTVATSAGRTFSFDSSFYNTGYQLKDIRLGAQASSAVNIVPRSSSITVAGSDVTYTGTAGWGYGDAYSTESYTGSAVVSAIVGQTNLDAMFGLNSDPLTDRSYASLDYAWRPYANGTLLIYESGAYVGTFGTYTTTDVLSIEYSGTNIVYKQNGVAIRTVATTAGRTFSFDSSFYNTGYQLKDIRFGSGAAQGTQLAYDGAGNRRSATQYVNGVLTTESYTYDDNNHLLTTNKNGGIASSRTYDLAGRVLEQISFSSPGVISERRVNAYNDNGWLNTLDIYDAANTRTQNVTYTQYDALGNVLNYQTSVYTGTNYTNYYSYTYKKFDSYKEQIVAGTSSLLQPGNTTSTYDSNGNLISVVDSAKSSNNRTFINDLSGRVLQKVQNGSTQYYFYANDKPVGSSGALSAADFDYNYTPVSDNYPATTPGKYVVSLGDTLQSIALAVFGDAKLWYLIADANGVKTDADLSVGQNLTIPNKVTNLHNDFKTFKPYSASSIIGDTTPTLLDPPPPPQPSGKKGGCGGLGRLIVIIVTVVVSVVTGGIGGVILGNIAGQLTGIALGVQDKFSWKSVASAAITAGITQGLGLNVPNLEGFALAEQVIKTSVISQGVNIALGIQDKFSWKAVAVAVIAAPIVNSITQSVAEAFDTKINDQGKIDTSRFDTGKAFAVNLVNGLATGVASQLVRQVVYGGGKFDFVAVAGDAFGNAIGESIKANQTTSGQQGTGALGKAEQEVTGDDPSNRARLTIPKGFSFAPELERRFNADIDLVAGGGGSDAGKASPVRETYVVQPGDSAARIGTNLYGDERKGLALLARLGLSNSDLTAGQSIDVSADDFSRAEIRAGGRGIAAYTAAEALAAQTQTIGAFSDGDPEFFGNYPGLPNSKVGGSGTDSIQSDPGFLSNLRNIGRAYINGKVNFSDATGMVNGQFGGIRNVLHDTAAGVVNGGAVIGEFALNFFPNSPFAAPSDPGYISLPRFSYSGKTGEFGGDIEFFGAVLIARGRGASSGSGVANSEVAAARVSRKPEWLARLEQGNAFNAERSAAYPHNEVYINKPTGSGYNRLDSYNPSTSEIVSRKFTQLSEIQPQTALNYINEIPAKYPVGGTIANVPSSRGLAGQALQGQYILEVPVQARPIPQRALDAANREGVLIRDVNGKVH